LTSELIASLSAKLRQIAQQPLEFCPDFPAIAKRWEAWWRFEADRPLVVTSAQKSGCDVRGDKAFDLHDQPQVWLDLRRRQLLATHRVGETLPFVRADIGPVAIAAFVGAPIHFSRQQNTSWLDPIIEDWASRPPLLFREDNPTFRRVMRLMDAIAADVPGRYLASMPDMSGAIDALAILRGSERLCLDLMDNPAPVHLSLPELLDAWERAHAAIYIAAVNRGVGLGQWVNCWSDVPYIVPTCDFNALIGEKAFEQHCLPSLAEQARRCGRCCFHLDGPAASRHARALAETPEITAIQYTPGAGTPSAVAMLPMLKMVQSYRKPLMVIVPANEVDVLAKALDPRGLVLWVGGVRSPEQADAIAQRIARG
jgi:hypothetical protein